MATPTQAEIEAKYLIRKYGGYYRPNSEGYTSSAIQAGRYTLEDAISITHPNGNDGPRDGMSFIREDDVACYDWQAYRKLQAERDASVARAEAAEKALLDAEGYLLRGHDKMAHNIIRAALPPYTKGE